MAWHIESDEGEESTTKNGAPSKTLQIWWRNQMLYRQAKEVKVAQSRPTLCDPMDYTVHGILQARILEWVAFCFCRGPSQPRDPTQVSCIAGGFFNSWATGKPKNTGLGSLSLLQQIFPMQGSNPGLPHCRRIIYQLSMIIYCRSSWKLIKPDFWEHPGHIPGTIRKASWYFCYSEM